MNMLYIYHCYYTDVHNDMVVALWVAPGPSWWFHMKDGPEWHTWCTERTRKLCRKMTFPQRQTSLAFVVLWFDQFHHTNTHTSRTHTLISYWFTSSCSVMNQLVKRVMCQTGFTTRFLSKPSERSGPSPGITVTSWSPSRCPSALIVWRTGAHPQQWLWMLVFLWPAYELQIVVITNAWLKSYT